MSPQNTVPYNLGSSVFMNGSAARIRLMTPTMAAMIAPVPLLVELLSCFEGASGGALTHHFLQGLGAKSAISLTNPLGSLPSARVSAVGGPPNPAMGIYTVLGHGWA